MYVLLYDAPSVLVVVDPALSILVIQDDDSFLVLAESNVFHAQYYT